MRQQPTRAETAGRIAVGLSAAFLAVLFLLHFLEPEFDPSWRLVSEYEIGHFGWMMRLAFFCWGGSALALLVGLWPFLRTIGGKIGRWWLLLIGVALFGAGMFATKAITDEPQGTANTLHTFSGAVVILTFPVAATLLVRSLARNQDWAAHRRALFWSTVVVWLGLIAFVLSAAVSNSINPAAGRPGPQVYQGWPNRFMVVVYNTWLIVVARYAARACGDKRICPKTSYPVAPNA